MITELMKNFFMLDLPLPVRRVKSIEKIRLFLIKGDDRCLLIDTGLNEPTFEGILSAELERLGADPQKTDLFVSHMHPDHCGLSHKFKKPSTRVYASEQEAAIINRTSDDAYWTLLYNKYRAEGLSMDYETFRASYPPSGFLPETPIDFEIIKDGDMINIGDYSFECVLLPGHGVSHACLYEKNTSVFICCDALLSDVPPILFYDEGLDDPLGAYLSSLKRLENMNISRVLPCHGDIDFDVKTRINELRQHYQKLCAESAAALIVHPDMDIHQITDLHTQNTIGRKLEDLSDVSYWFFYIPIFVSIQYMLRNGDITVKKDDRGINVYRAG